jgi:hypothetical protein
MDQEDLITVNVSLVPSPVTVAVVTAPAPVTVALSTAPAPVTVEVTEAAVGEAGPPGANAPTQVLTLAAYLALTPEAQLNGTWYVIPRTS